MEIKNQIYAFLAPRGIKTPSEYRSALTDKHQGWLRSLHLSQIDVLLDIVYTLRKKINKVEGEIDRSSQKKDDVELLKTIPGVGDVIANTLVAEICDFQRFSSPENLFSYAGMVSSIHQSGEKDDPDRLPSKGMPASGISPLRQHIATYETPRIPT